MGCSLAASLVDNIKDIKRKRDPDRLFIEASEMVTTREMRNVSAMGQRDIRYEAGPFLTLINGLDFEFLWNERRRLVSEQINGADWVIVNRMDDLSAEEAAFIHQTLADCRQRPLAANGLDRPALESLAAAISL